MKLFTPFRFALFAVVVVIVVALVLAGAKVREADRTARGGTKTAPSLVTVPHDFYRGVTAVIDTITARPEPPQEFQYIEILDGCGPYYDGTCANMRSGPGTKYPALLKLRIGMVLKVEQAVVVDGSTWYKIAFDKEVRYPERISSDWYVSSEVAHLLANVGDQEAVPKKVYGSTKRIVVDRAQEMLRAYDGDTLFMEESISTGLDDTPTPRGTFTIFKKTPSRYMQGPIPGISDQYYDLPGVPWNLYFTVDGAAIHGAYWHDHFGSPWSHGCVNLPPATAQKLYEWADIGTKVTVID